MQYLPSCVQLHRCKNYPSSGSMCLSRYMFACNSTLSLLCVCCGSIYITCLMLPVCVPVLLPARMRMIFFVKCSHCSKPHIPSHSTFYVLFVLLCVFHVIYLPVLGSRSLVSCWNRLDLFLDRCCKKLLIHASFGFVICYFFGDCNPRSVFPILRILVLRIL